ncbi:MAG: hypothetical protein AAB897_03550 [Patescibacteria group bacterium]
MATKGPENLETEDLSQVELPEAKTAAEQRAEIFDEQMREAKIMLGLQKNLTETQKKELLTNVERSLNKWLDYEDMRARGGFSDDDMKFLAESENPYHFMTMSVEEKERLYKLQSRVQEIKYFMREEEAGLMETEESVEPGHLESIVEELDQEGKEINDERKKLNVKALEAGRKKWGFDAAEWSDELRGEMDALQRKSTWNLRLRNEVTNPSEKNSKSRSLEDIEKGLRQKIFESVRRLTKEFEGKEIDANSKIKLYEKWDINEKHPRECFFSHIDPETGLLYASDAKIKKGGSNVLYGLKVEDVARVDKLPGGTFEKLKSKLKGGGKESSPQGK